MFDVVALGEALIDFAPCGRGQRGNPAFEMNPGGAPANCLAEIARLGGKTAFIGTVGDDFFGEFLIAELVRAGIDADAVKKKKKIPTTLAFVSIGAKGERQFSFIRKPGADIMLKKEDIAFDMIDKARIFHFGSLSLTDRPARDATFAALQYAKQKGKTISYDPNYRERLWSSKKPAVKWMLEGLVYADIVKMSEEELYLLTGNSDIARGAEQVQKTGKKAVFITAGERGAFFATQKSSGFVPGFRVEAVDTTGCGDAFMGAILYQICREPEKNETDMTMFANAAGALCAIKFGGIPSMPEYEEVVQLIKEK
jgi:fructokinase